MRHNHATACLFHFTIGYHANTSLLRVSNFSDSRVRIFECLVVKPYQCYILIESKVQGKLIHVT